jgi:hypothetical protein
VCTGRPRRDRERRGGASRRLTDSAARHGLRPAVDRDGSALVALLALVAPGVSGVVETLAWLLLALGSEVVASAVFVRRRAARRRR